jgi:translation initiation factor IF-2
MSIKRLFIPFFVYVNKCDRFSYFQVKHARLGQAQQKNLDLGTQTDLELRKRLDDMETELQQTQVEELAKFGHQENVRKKL